MISRGLSVSLFFACLCFSYACLGVESAAAWGLMALNFFLHINVVGWPGFWINHNVFSLSAFGMVGGGGGRERVHVCFVWLFFFFIWSKKAETCLEIFQLPVFLFDITFLFILCQPSFPPRKQEALLVCIYEATSCLNHKDHGEHPVCTFKTKWCWGTNAASCFFFLPLQSCWCSKQAPRLAIGSLKASSQS